MQLQLTLPERQMLADILEQKRYALAEKGQGLSAREDAMRRDIEEMYEKVVAKHLQFSADELDIVTDLLAEHDRVLRQQEAQDEVRRVLQSLNDKIVETCAMV